MTITIGNKEKDSWLFNRMGNWLKIKGILIALFDKNTLLMTIRHRTRRFYGYF